jgi:RNA polymerase sigma-70 factor (sigma-E family)
VVTDAAAGRIEVSTADPEAAIEATFRRDYADLVALARLLVDDRGEAEEVVQEAFVRTFARRRELRRAAGDPTPYLRRAVVNLCRGGLRKRRTQRATPVPLPDDAPAADRAVVQREDQAELLAALRRLPSRQRECVVLRYLLDASTDDTADTLGISAGSVKTHLHRGLAALEADLKDKQ